MERLGRERRLPGLVLPQGVLSTTAHIPAARPSPPNEVELWETFVEGKRVSLSMDGEFRVPPFRTPPLSPVDTIFWSPGGGSTSIHGMGVFLADPTDVLEIVPVRELENPFRNGVELALGVTEDGKHMLLQPGQRACVAATTAMLILDAGGTPDWNWVLHTNLSTGEIGRLYLERAGFGTEATELVKDCHEQRMEQLAGLIERNGSGMVGMSSNIGAHNIIIDRVNVERGEVTIREPYHGVMLRVRSEAIVPRLGGSFLQIQRVPEESERSTPRDDARPATNGPTSAGEAVDPWPPRRMCRAEQQQLSAIRKRFALPLGGLQSIRRRMAESIRSGLEVVGQPIAAIPTYVALPSPSTAGTAVTLDMGGTKIGAALVELDGKGGARILPGPPDVPHEARNRDVPLTKAELLDKLATAVSRAEPPEHAPLGISWSFSGEATPDGDVRHSAFQKEIRVEGFGPGTPVGSSLVGPLEARGYRPRAIAVANDGIGGLASAAYMFARQSPERTICAIGGTGHNFALYLTPRQAPKLRALSWDPDLPMAINLESGSFPLSPLTPWDETVDMQSEVPGDAPFEKAVAGVYLAALYNAMLPTYAIDEELGSHGLVSLRDDRKAPLLASETAGMVLKRSADLVASGLAGVIDCMGYGPPITILVEGSLFLGDPKYKARVTRTLSKLLASTPRSAKQEFRFVSADKAVLIGTACIALDRSGARTPADRS